jgi:protein CpxP
MKKNTLLYILIILLIGFNGYFIATQFKKPLGNKPGGPEVFIAKEFNFDEAQMAQFNVLMAPHDAKMKELGHQEKRLEDDLFELMFLEEVPQSAMDSILIEIGRSEQSRDTEVFNHFREVRKICNESQQKKFEKIVVGALHRNGPPPPPRK